MSIAAVELKNPFPGLRPFQKGEEHLFFGRERQVDTMVDKLAATRFLAVVGTSGSGKSSLVNCGLRPALHRGLMARAGTAWRVAQFRPGGNPLRSLAAALATPGGLFGSYRPEGVDLEDIVEATLRMGSVGLAQVYEQATTGEPTNLLVVADQFEELFRYHQTTLDGHAGAYSTSPDAIALVSLLLQARVQSDFPIYVALTMRSDFLGECCQFHSLPEAMNDGQFLVPRLTRDERRAVIASPIAVAGGALDPVLLTRLVNDVGDNPDQLSILQHALNRTWAHWHHDAGATGPISLPHYEAIGTMSTALDRHAEKAFGELRDARGQMICQKIFRTLTDRGTDARGVRRPTTMAALCAIADASPAEVADVINVFRKPSRSFLMPPRTEALDPSTIVDISHESLMRVWERLKKWTDVEARSARTYRRLAETAALHIAGTAGLWRDPDLQLALEWRRRENPTAAWGGLYLPGFDAAMEFLEESRLARDGERAERELATRWRRIEILILCVLLATFVYNFDRHSGPLKNFFSFLPDRDGDGHWASFASMIVLLFPYSMTYLGLRHWGRILHRRWAYDRVLAEAAAAADRPVEVVADVAPATDVAYASFWKRAGAWTIDFIVFVLVVALWGFSISVLPHDWEAFLISAAYGTDLLYDALLTSSRWQGTVGKRLMGIAVTDMRGRRLPFWRAACRHMAKILSWYTVGFLVALFTKKRQTVHDLVVRTVVIARRIPAVPPPPGG